MSTTAPTDPQELERYADIAEQAIREAIRLGLPILYKRLVRAAFLVRRPGRGKGVLFTSTLPGDSEEDPEGTLYVTLSSEPVTVWKIAVARLEPGHPPALYPHQVVAAVAQYPTVMSTHEADVWRRRLAALHQGRAQPAPLEELPRELIEELEPAPEKALRLPDIPGDYAVISHGLVVAWYNSYTGDTVKTAEYLRAAHLLP